MKNYHPQPRKILATCCKIRQLSPFFFASHLRLLTTLFYADPLENPPALPQIFSWPTLPFFSHHRLHAAARFDTPPCFFLRLSPEKYLGLPQVFLHPPTSFLWACSYNRLLFFPPASSETHPGLALFSTNSPPLHPTFYSRLATLFGAQPPQLSLLLASLSYPHSRYFISGASLATAEILAPDF
ncbi:hypothetical protein E4631_22345 [Hymenobacter sp. UV11]|uniref:hypothetical protein n=1 Tax=Hymenobacter sp. UV11 TaxID=1849735 RepID=UPI00105C580A|nr:hypothetical protein [Hymenobacter sp. UV11]TFZ63575.1 hypothetical protein E4631_22345 [Hymenobacter sp. UV11]